LLSKGPPLNLATQALAPKVSIPINVHVHLAHVRTDHKLEESVVSSVFHHHTVTTNKHLEQISPSTLILLSPALQKKVNLLFTLAVYELLLSFAEDKPSSSSNVLASSSLASASSSNTTLSSNMPVPSSSTMSNALAPERQQPSPLLKAINPTTPESEFAPSFSSQQSALVTLREKVENLPRTVPVANKTNVLASYSQPPQKLTSDIQNDADIWETWDQKLNVLLPHNINDLKHLVVRGKFGLIGLVGFFEHLVRDRKVDEGLLEGKAKRLIDAINVYVSFLSDSRYNVLISIGACPPQRR
jgi:hypothetical protein